MKKLLLVLVVLLGLGRLAYKLWQHHEEPRAKQCVGDERILTTALNWYAVDNDGFPPPRPQILIPIYIKALPECQGVAYDYEVVGTQYTVSCHSGHAAFRMPPGYPRMATGQPPGKFLILRP